MIELLVLFASIGIVMLLVNMTANRVCGSVDYRTDALERMHTNARTVVHEYVYPNDNEDDDPDGNPCPPDEYDAETEIMETHIYESPLKPA